MYRSSPSCVRPVWRRLPLVLLAAGIPGLVGAQIPHEFRNLQVLPRTISRDSLITVMRRFSFATGLRCENCHVMGEGGSFEGARFDLDEKVEKEQARHMLRMVNRINDELLAGLPHRDAPSLAVECKTCHRGVRKPWLLRTELRRIIETQGIDSATARYRELRANRMPDGIYDFGEWEMNELARELDADGRVGEAIRMLELNEEHHPQSPSIPRTLGSLYERLGRHDEAIAAYRRVLALRPGEAALEARIRQLAGERPPLE